MVKISECFTSEKCVAHSIHGCLEIVLCASRGELAVQKLWAKSGWFITPDAGKTASCKGSYTVKGLDRKILIAVNKTYGCYY